MSKSGRGRAGGSSIVMAASLLDCRVSGAVPSLPRTGLLSEAVGLMTVLRMRAQRKVSGLAYVFGVVLGVAGPAGADGDPGRALYQRYCGACHGREARGDGPVAESLGQRPLDLTTIAREHGGHFPFAEVMAVIDGTRSVRSHGVSEMPVWGEVFRPQPGWSLGEHAAAKGRILLITEYLQTVQKK